MDLRPDARSIVESALRESFPVEPPNFNQWLRQPLTTLFPEQDRLSEFLNQVAKTVRDFRAKQDGVFQLKLPASRRKVNPLANLDTSPLFMAGATGEVLIGLVEYYLSEGPPEELLVNPTSPSWETWDNVASTPPRLPVPPSAPAPKLPAKSTESRAPRTGTLDASIPTRSDSVIIGDAKIDILPNASLVRVFYATDRLKLPTLNKRPRYERLRSFLGHIHYGECAISIPKIHKLGKLETPSILKLEFRPDPEKHITVYEIETLEESVFLERIAASVAVSVAKEALVFVHGYKVSFEDAARRTGQIAFDLHFVGAPIFYSWPSNGKLADYLKDETNITWSTPHFQRFLSLISQHSGAKRMHIIAHSMGNRAVCDALKTLSSDPNCNLKFNHLVLAAPDIDADTFRELAATLQRLSGRITLYESSKDKAIQASKKIHGNSRAGEPLLVIPGLDTIVASAIDTDFLGHSYFSDNWPLLSDIYSILSKDTPPSERFGLKEMDDPSGKYYAFRA